MCICPKIVKDVKNVEKSRFWSRSRDFCQIFDDFGFGFKKFGIGKKVSVSVSENLVWEKKSRYRFRKFGIGKKVSVSVSENLVSEKSLGIGFGQNFGIVIQCLEDL